jgi:hypothetical protein
MHVCAVNILFMHLKWHLDRMDMLYEPRVRAALCTACFHCVVYEPRVYAVYELRVFAVYEPHICTVYEPQCCAVYEPHGYAVYERTRCVRTACTCCV